MFIVIIAEVKHELSRINIKPLQTDKFKEIKQNGESTDKENKVVRSQTVFSVQFLVYLYSTKNERASVKRLQNMAEEMGAQPAIEVCLRLRQYNTAKQRTILFTFPSFWVLKNGRIRWRPEDNKFSESLSAH